LIPSVQFNLSGGGGGNLRLLSPDTRGEFINETLFLIMDLDPIATNLAVLANPLPSNPNSLGTFTEMWEWM
jgi:hypothetical protein